MNVTVYAPGLTVEVIDREPAPDTNPPETVLVGGPTDSTATDATITFIGSDSEGGAVTFEGRLDGGAWAPVVAPVQLAGLAVGAHTYEVRAIDAAGNVDATPASVMWTVEAPPPAGGPGTWTKYPCAYGNTSYPEAEYQSWYNLAHDAVRDLFYGMDWFGVVAAFSHYTQSWTKLTPDIGGGTHNRTFVVDPHNDRLWIGEGTGSTLTGVNYLDLATGVIVPHTTTTPRFGSESAAIFDPARKRLIVFGGWTLLGVHTFALDPPASALVHAGLTGGPNWSPSTSAVNAAQKMTAWRSGLDAARDRVWFVDVDGSLWVLPCALTGWQKLATIGTPPHIYTQYCYDPTRDTIYGWTPSSMVAGGATNDTPTQETWALPLATMTWQKLANAAAGDTVPPITTYTGYSLVYDPVRQRPLLHTLRMNNFSPETWAFTPP